MRGLARQGRFLTWESLRWVVRHRAWTPWYLVRYWRFFWFKMRNPHIVTRGFVFLGRRVEVSARKGYGLLVLGRWVHVGDENRLRCHEGVLTVGDKCVFGRDNTVNCYLDIEIGAGTIVAETTGTSAATIGGALAPAAQFAALPVPESYRAVTVHKDEVGMFEGMSTKEKDPRKSIHIDEVPLPDNAIIAAIASGGDVEVANDETVLHPGDKAIVVADEDVLDDVRLAFRGL